MQPKPTDIALIAATLARGENPEQFIDQAIRLHSRCWQVLQTAQEGAGEHHPKATIRFGDFLATLDHRLRPNMARKRFFEFLREKVISPVVRATNGGNDPGDLLLQRYTQQEIDRLKREGIAYGFAEKWIPMYSQWRRETVSAKKAIGGKAKAARQALQRNERRIADAMKPSSVGKKSRFESHPPEIIEKMAEQSQSHGRMTPRR